MSFKDSQGGSFKDSICENYKDPSLPEKYKIGYSNYRNPFIIIPSFALILNLFLIVRYIRNKTKHK